MYQIKTKMWGNSLKTTNIDGTESGAAIEIDTSVC